MPDHQSEASVTMKQVVIFLLVEDLAFNLFEKLGEAQ